MFAWSGTLGSATPFALYGLAIMASGALGGSRAAYLASLLSTLTGWYYFLGRPHSFEIPDLTTLARVLVSLAEELLISAIMARIEAARKAAAGDQNITPSAT